MEVKAMVSRVPDALAGSVSIQFSPYVPARSTNERWVPPGGDQFCQYGPEDEAWMRPLGLGTVVEEDAGPCYFKVQEPSFLVTMPDVDFPVLREPLDDAMIRFRHRMASDLFRSLAVPSAIYHNVTS